MITKGYIGDNIKGEYIKDYCILRMIIESNYVLSTRQILIFIDELSYQKYSTLIREIYQNLWFCSIMK